MFVVFGFFSAMGALAGAVAWFDCALSAPLFESRHDTRNTTMKRWMDLLRMMHLPHRVGL
jgi:hypothetical protein